MNKYLIPFFLLILNGCGNNINEEGKNNVKTLISYEKYDFLSNEFIPINNIYISFKNNFFLIKNILCQKESFIDFSPSFYLPINDDPEIFIGYFDLEKNSGIENFNNQLNVTDCFYLDLEVEIKQNNYLFQNKKTYNIRINSEFYNFVLSE